ncbi:998_t:CDS:1, partial [Gigaspora margarita]
KFIEKENIKSFSISSFNELTFLGAGGYGDVYHAYSEDRKEIVALKKVRNNAEESFTTFTREV